MQFEITPATMINSYVIYIMQNMQQQDVFIWWCKFTDLLKFKDAIKNPAFNVNQRYTVYIVEYHSNARDAQNAFSRVIAQRGMPPCNLTHDFNRIGSIRCNETGHVYRNQAEIVRLHGINATALSQHLRRAKGYKSVKGMTFSRAAYLDNSRKPTDATPSRMIYTHKTSQAVRCIESGQVFKSQRDACAALGINAGQLSQHLQGHAGYKTVKGFTFERCEPIEQPPQRIDYRGEK